MRRAPLVISHRTHAGAKPENSIIGVDAALAEHVDGIEIDVRATSDGVVVLLHDETLERTVGDPRAITDVPYEDARVLGVPALRDVLARVAGRAIVVVEVKQAEIHDLVAAEVRRAAAAPWVWTWSFSPQVVVACRRALPASPASLLVAPGSLARYGATDDPVGFAVREGLAGISWNHAMVDDTLVEWSRRRGLATYTWTPNEPEDLARVRDAGVDAICSDFPSRVRTALGA